MEFTKWRWRKRRAHFKATASFDGFIVQNKSLLSICCGFKLSDTIIYLCKMKGTFVTRHTLSMVKPPSKWQNRQRQQKKRTHFSFVSLIIIIKRAASYWLRQRHAALPSNAHIKVLTLAFCPFRSFQLCAVNFTIFCLHSIFVLDLVCASFRWTRLLSLICLIFIMPFSTNILRQSTAYILNLSSRMDDACFIHHKAKVNGSC